MEIKFDPEIVKAAPGLKVLLIEAEVDNPPTTDALWRELLAEGEKIRGRYMLEQINKRPAIAATRTAYKALGKEPNRYRPSAEALCRRLVKGLELYRTLALIDIINLISVETGYSIGGFDADKIEGTTLTLGAGREGEPFEAIGRGPLNIHCLPVYRDAVGGIGTPTSDNERTKLTPETRRLLMTVNIYGEEASPADVEAMTRRLLSDHCNLKSFESAIIEIP